MPSADMLGHAVAEGSPAVDEKDKPPCVQDLGDDHDEALVEGDKHHDATAV